MPEDISLLPKEVERKKEQEARDRLLRRGGLAFLAVSLLLALGVFVYSLTLNSRLSNLEQDIAGEMSKISSLSEIELDAKDLERRVEGLAKILEEKLYFSDLLSALAEAVPGDVAIAEVTAPSEEAVSISGTSRSYVSLKQFLLNLKETDSASVDFKAVGLRSVSLDQQTGGYNFELTLVVEEGGLRK